MKRIIWRKKSSYTLVKEEQNYVHIFIMQLKLDHKVLSHVPKYVTTKNLKFILLPYATTQSSLGLG